MIQQQSILKVSDNSGAKTVKCIKVLGGFKKKYANLGDIIVVAVQNLRNKSKKTTKVKKKEIYRALIVKTSNKIKKKDGHITQFSNNSVVLIKSLDKPVGTRIIGPVSKKLKKKKFQKILAMSIGLI
jgi:large subunit ribosomal protein L14